MPARLARFALAILLGLSSAAPPAVLATSPAHARSSGPLSITEPLTPVRVDNREVDSRITNTTRGAPLSGRIMLPPAQIVETIPESNAPIAGHEQRELLSTASSDSLLALDLALLPPGRLLQQTPVISEVRICDVDTGCLGPATNTFATDTPLVLYAAGYTETFAGNQTVTWTVSSPIAVPSPEVGVSTTLDGNTPGSIVVTATLDADPTISSTATFTITTGALARIAIRSDANGGGSEVGAATRTAGTDWSLFAAGYDLDNNFIADQVVTWTLTGGIGSIAPARDESTTFTAITATTGIISAEASPTFTDTTGTITVAAGSPDHLRVTLAPTGTAGIGFSAGITVEDAFNNTVLTYTDPIALTTPNGGDLSPSSVDPAAGVWTGSITLTIAGANRTVNAQSGSITGTAGITINPGSASILYLDPPSATRTAGQSIAYTAVATDSFGNSIGNVTGQTSFTIPSASGGAFAGNAVTPTVASTWTVTGLLSSAVDTATLSVNPGAVFTVTLAPASDVISAGTRTTYTATATDVYSNPIGDVTGQTTFSISPGSGGTFVGNIITPTLVGSFTVTGTHSGGRFGRALLQVVPSTPTSLVLLPATAVISAGVRLTYAANAFDTYGNLVGNVTSDTSFAVGPNPGAPFVGSAITPTIRGAYTVTGMHGGFSLSDTAVFTVTPAAPSTLTLLPATDVISAGTRITYTAIATDVYGNGIGNVTPGTTFSIYPAAGGTFAGSSITPTIKGTYTVTGTHTGSGTTDTAALSVTPASLFSLSIENAPNGTGTPIGPTTITLYNTLTLYAIDYDRYDNVIGQNPSTWTASGVLSGTLSPPTGFSTTLTPAPILSGTGIVAAVAGAFSDTAGPITITAPVLQISKSASPITATPGSLLRYNIYYTNTGNGAAQNVVITETYPASTTFDSAFPDPDLGTNNVWTIGDLPPQTSGNLQVWVLLASEFPVGSVLTNTVRIGAPKVDTAIFTRTTPVTSTPDVKVIVSDSADPVRPGDLFIYTIQYRNDGSAPVTNLRITETYPSGVTYISANPSPSSGNNVWVTNTLGAGQSRFIFVTVRANSPLPDGTVLDNTVTIDADSPVNPFSDTELTSVSAPTLSLAKSASTSTPAANSVLTYTLAYTNSGSSYASNVIITDAVPINTQYLSCAPAGSCNQAGNVVTWALGQMLAQTTGRLTMTVNVNNNLVNGTILTNTARISATEGISAFVRITGTVVSAPALSLTKSDGVASAAAGQTLTYSLMYANSGNAPTSNVVITDRIPSNVTYQSCAPSGLCSQAGGTVTWTIGTVTATTGSAVTVTVRVSSTLPAGVRAITNTARIQTTTPGDNPSDNFTQDVDTISTVPVLAMNAIFSGTAPYPTRVVTYTVRYTNTSAMNTTGVVISVTRSPFVTYIAAGSSAWLPAGGSVYTMPIGNLAAGASGVATFVTQLPTPFTAATDAFVNVFSISDNGPGGLPPATAIHTATLGVPDLIIESVAVSPNSVAPGQPFTATLVIRNQGLGRACDRIPPSDGCGSFGLDWFIDPAAPPPTYPFGGYGDDFIYVPAIDAGKTATVTITNLSFTAAQSFTLYFKIDNWNCAEGGNPCDPDSSAQHGLVAESDEFNNVFGPVPVDDARIHHIFLPVVTKNR